VLAPLVAGATGCALSLSKELALSLWKGPPVHPVQCAFSTEEDALARRLAQHVVLFFLTLATASAQTPRQRTIRHIDAIRKDPSLLLAFLDEMPKGGDLHNHRTGAIYAESWIDYAARDNLCVDRSTSNLLPPPCDPNCAKYTNKPAVQCAYGDHVLYNQLVAAWSMRNWTPGDSSGHDHFFATFDKFHLASLNSVGDQLAEIAARAADDHLQYVELMTTADGNGA